MGDKSEEPSSPTGQGGSDRKITKPLMEKRRRARINSCLTELKALLLTNADEKESGRFAKLEKADILELTVKYLRARQQTTICGNHTALYRAGFNKCMEELSTFLGADDDNSANLRLKLTTHLANILCSMDRLKDDCSKGHAERSNVSPGLQVSSSSDDVMSAPNTIDPTGNPTSLPTDSTEGKSLDRPTAESPTAKGYQLCQMKGALPLTVNSAGSLFPAPFGQQENTAINVPAYTTIPVVPTVLPQGQVLLLVPNNNNNSNNGKLGFQIPAFTSSTLGGLCAPRDNQPVVQPDTSGFTSFICPTSVPKNDLVLSEINGTKSVALHIMKPEPLEEPTGSPCARQPCTESATTGQDFSPASAKVTTRPETKDERFVMSSAAQNCTSECRVGNSDPEDKSLDPQGAMWRPW